MTERTVVIGGGIGALSAARSLVMNGRAVTLLEAAPKLGGLVDGFTVAGQPLERFYHYLFPREAHILELIDELGLTDRVEWFPSTIGILIEGRVWPFTSPLDLLRFRPLGPFERLRAGVGALRLGRVREWKQLDAVPAREWLTGHTSPAVTEVVWDPLLRAKFGPAAGAVPAAWMWGRLDQRRQARRGSGEVLGYMRGGFTHLFDALADDLRRRGADLRVATRARAVVLHDGRVAGVDVGDEVITANTVLFAGTLPQLPPLLPANVCDKRWLEARGLGAMCVILSLPRQLTQVFWTNVCDRTIPFGGIIEHTNLVPTEWYGGRHVVYLSRYFTSDESIAETDPHDEAERWLDQLETLFPRFSRRDLLSTDVFRTPYAAPLVTTPYLPHIPPVKTHIPGLFVTTTAQIYPQDRGMSEGIRRSALSVAEMLEYESCPVGDG